MSASTYSASCYGVYLSKGTLKTIAEKMYSDYDENEFRKDPFAYYEAIMDDLAAEVLYNFTGEALGIDDSGKDDFSDAVSFECESVFFLPLNNEPTLFGCAYPSIEHAVSEVHAKLRKYLPDNFDYRGNLRHFVGTETG